MKKFYTRREVDEAVHNAIVDRESRQYAEERFRRLEKELEEHKNDMGKRIAELDMRLCNLEMARRYAANCVKGRTRMSDFNLNHWQRELELAVRNAKAAETMGRYDVASWWEGRAEEIQKEIDEIIGGAGCESK